MDHPPLYYKLRDHFPFEPTQKQDAFFQMVSRFLVLDPDSIFLLKGYAGTGKTTALAALVGLLEEMGRECVLMAPTGRAAKVMSHYSGRQAQTIHRKIYYPKKGADAGVNFSLMPNRHREAVFIVDEASMISDAPTDGKSYQSGSLLDDLITYIYTGTRCCLILVGDTAQLPPVGRDLSPALDVTFLEREYGMKVYSIELDEVMRQQAESGILENATLIRERLSADDVDFQFDLAGFRDIVRLTDGYAIQDAIHDSYSNLGMDETAFIVRSNKRANLYNNQIRARILDRDSRIGTGDILMVVKNNYFWLRDDSQAGFIANGDLIEVLEIFSVRELYGFHFAHVKVRMLDYPDQIPLETLLLLDTLESPSPSLTPQQSQHLFEQVSLDYEEERTAWKRLKLVRENEHFNALQVKFAYAITGHKAQGGQWHTVFVEQPFMPEGPDREYLRWLYTAITRATHKVYLIGFADENFKR